MSSLIVERAITSFQSSTFMVISGELLEALQGRKWGAGAAYLIPDVENKVAV